MVGIHSTEQMLEPTPLITEIEQRVRKELLSQEFHLVENSAHSISDIVLHVRGFHRTEHLLLELGPYRNQFVVE